MFRNSSLLNFFRPAPKPQKRPTPDDNSGQQSPREEQRPSKSPKLSPQHSSPYGSPSNSVDEGDDVQQTSIIKDHRATAPSPAKDGDAEQTDISSLTSLSDIEPVSSPPPTEPQSSSDLPRRTSTLTESFISTGSLSGSSQRVTRNGEEMVIDSDENSDASLEDLDTLLGISKAKSPSTPATHTTVSNVPTRTLSSTRNTRSNKPNFTKRNPPPIPKYKFMIDDLAAAVKKETVRDAEVTAALDEARQLDLKIAALAGKTVNEAEINTELLASVVKGEDGPDAERVIQAVERTDALQGKKVWRFFAGDTSTAPAPAIPNKLPPPFKTLLEIPLNRDATITGGFLQDLVSKRRLPNALIQFILQAAVLEKRNDFHTSYCNILAELDQSSLEILDFNMVSNWFSLLGVPETLLDDKLSIEPETMWPKKDTNDNTKDWTLLRNVMRVLYITAKGINLSTRRYVLVLLSKVALDVDAMADPGLIILLQDLFAALVDSVPETELKAFITEFMFHIYHHLSDSHLRVRFIEVLATGSPRISQMRVKLSLAFFFDKTAFLSDWSATVSPGMVLQYLEDSRLDITDELDFSWLGAKMTLLDIGFDDGHAPRERDTEIEKRYNKRLDRLTDALHIKHAKIKDSGANHLARTETKEAIVMLKDRLLFAVRTRRPRKDDTFDISANNAKIPAYFKVPIKESNSLEKEE